MLRAYYAWKNGLPFSYVDKIEGDGSDILRFSQTSNRAPVAPMIWWITGAGIPTGTRPLYTISTTRSGPRPTA